MEQDHKMYNCTVTYLTHFLTHSTTNFIKMNSEVYEITENSHICGQCYEKSSDCQI